MIVLDASVLIAHLDDRDAHHEQASKLIEGTVAEPLAASVVTLAETLVAPARAGRLEDARGALERLRVAELALGDDAAARLAQLRVDTARKLPDCCVLLAAQEHAATVASLDSDLIDTARALGLKTLS